MDFSDEATQRWDKADFDALLRLRAHPLLRGKNGTDNIIAPILAQKASSAKELQEVIGMKCNSEELGEIIVANKFCDESIIIALVSMKKHGNY